jgi:bifunctional non-homologous end joining protein LigD
LKGKDLAGKDAVETAKEPPAEKAVPSKNTISRPLQKEEAGRKLSDYIPAMLAKDTDTPFSHEDWIYEIKWDGYRAIAEVNKGDVKLYSRNGNSFIANYPSIYQNF